MGALEGLFLMSTRRPKTKTGTSALQFAIMRIKVSGREFSAQFIASQQRVRPQRHQHFLGSQKLNLGFDTFDHVPSMPPEINILWQKNFGNPDKYSSIFPMFYQILFCLGNIKSQLFMSVLNSIKNGVGNLM